VRNTMDRDGTIMEGGGGRSGDERSWAMGTEADGE